VIVRVSVSGVGGTLRLAKATPLKAVIRASAITATLTNLVVSFLAEKHHPDIYDICINVKGYLPIASRNNAEPRESPWTHLY
jgi:hypothetical protein